jgi:glycine betaine/choline ABC-type transport system substrate-binding protein
METRFLIPLIAVAGLLPQACSRPPANSIRVGGKNFTEQLILSELTAQVLEQRGLPVSRHPGFGGTPLVHQALVSGAIDVYIEYTGTAWQVNLGQPPESLEELRARYRDRFHLEILQPLGFQNGYVFAGRRGTVPSDLSALVPLAPSITAGFNAEFLARPDGWPLIAKSYGLRFRDIVNLDAGLIYRVLDEGRAGVICGFSTDAHLASDRYRVIRDDLGVFPRYDAVPVVRPEALAGHPGLREALESLAGRIDETTMRELNRQAELGTRSISDLVRGWLRDSPASVGLRP